MIKNIKLLYEHAVKSNNSAMIKDLDGITAQYMSGSDVSESLKSVIKSHGILFKPNGTIFECKNYITESVDISSKNKKSLKAKLSILESTAIKFSDRSLIIPSEFKSINEAFSIIDGVVTESYEDLSQLDFVTGDYECYSYDDFISTFDERYVSDNYEKFEPLQLYFNDGASIIINIIDSSDSLTGFSAELSYNDGFSELKQKSIITNLTKHYVESAVADYINESIQPDDDLVQDYPLNDPIIAVGKTYQIVDSNAKNPELSEFTEFVVSDVNDKTITIVVNGNTYSYDINNVSGIRVVLMDDYEVIFEDITDESVLESYNLTKEELLDYITEFQIQWSDVEKLMSEIESGNPVQLLGMTVLKDKDYGFTVKNGEVLVKSINKTELYVAIILELIGSKITESTDDVVVSMYDLDSSYVNITGSNIIDDENLEEFSNLWSEAMLSANVDKLILDLCIRYNVESLLVVENHDDEPPVEFSNEVRMLVAQRVSYIITTVDYEKLVDAIDQNFIDQIEIIMAEFNNRIHNNPIDDTAQLDMINDIMELLNEYKVPYTL